MSDKDLVVLRYFIILILIIIGFYFFNKHKKLLPEQITYKYTVSLMQQIAKAQTLYHSQTGYYANTFSDLNISLQIKNAKEADPNVLEIENYILTMKKDYLQAKRNGFDFNGYFIIMPYSTGIPECDDSTSRRKICKYLKAEDIPTNENPYMPE